MTTDQPLDDESIRLAYRAAAQDEPGPQLDAQILQAAHAALATPARKPARWSWLVLPFSAAAVAIVVTTLVLQMRQTPNTPPLQSASAPPAQAVKPEVAAAPATQPPELKIADAKPAKKAERPAEPAASNHDARQDPAAQIASADDALLEQRHKESGKLAAAAPPLTRSVKSAPQPTPSIAQPLADADSTPVGAAVSGAAPPSAAAASAAKRAEASADRLAEAEPRSARESKLQAYSAPAKARSQDGPTEKQLENIRKLQREGKLEAAKKALAELRKQFPHYKVSEDLRALIEPGSEENKDHP